MRSNPLGDVRAEADHAMLDVAYYESPDYRSIIEFQDRAIIVGRRGTGKSALCYRLQKYWSNQGRNRVLKLAPEEHEVFGLRSFATKYGIKNNVVRGVCRIFWRHALELELISQLIIDNNFNKLPHAAIVQRHLRVWRAGGNTFFERLRFLLQSSPASKSVEGDDVAELYNALESGAIEESLKEIASFAKNKTHLLLDCLDEGYEPDASGVGLIAGLIYAVIDINSRIDNIKAMLFLRDNILRSIATFDSDYSRTIEGQVLRLHWDEHSLFAMICLRLAKAFDIKQEQSLTIWRDCSERELSGMDGFKLCLRHTLYRPRDLVLLLNSAFYSASKRNSGKIVPDDIRTSATELSQNRFDDLVKEYSAVSPGLQRYCTLFSGGAPELRYDDVSERIERLRHEDDLPPPIQQELSILDKTEDIIAGLFSVGFFGIKDEISGNFKFCHDGRSKSFEIKSSSIILIHPCYWMALNLTSEPLTKDEISQINDEYDLEITSVTPKIRAKKLGKLIADLQQIELGITGASNFEEWARQAIATLFAGGLRNVELHPNKDATQRRDVVARNAGSTSAWARVLHDYGTRQVIFEIKNFDHDLGSDEFRQMNSYLAGSYGRIGFIINRYSSNDVAGESELRWIREIYHNDKKLIIKIGAGFLSNQLSKLRSPIKHDVADQALEKLIDNYERVYLSLGSSLKKRSKAN